MRPARRAGFRPFVLAALLVPMALPPALRGQTSNLPSETKRVLVLFSDEVALPGNVEVDRGLRTKFKEDRSLVLEVYNEYLDLSRFGGEEYEQRLANLLAHKYRDRQPHVVIAAGSLALLFDARWRALIAPGVPVIYCGALPETVRALPPDFPTRGAPADFDFRGTAEAALPLRPGTRTIAVVGGASEADKRYLESARSQLAVLQNRVSLEYLAGLPLDLLLERLAGLPDESVVLYVSIYRDGSGKMFRSPDALDLVAASARVPVFSMSDTYLGHGIVGGHLFSWESAGARAGELALRTLHGSQPGELSPSAEGLSLWMFDARQLQRWGIHGHDLPAGSQVLFRPSSLWRDYPWWMAGGILFFILETALIAGLVVQRALRRRAEERQQFLSAIVESSNDAVIGVSLDNRILSWNRGAENMYGYTAEEVIGRNLAVLVPPDRAHELHPAHETVRAGGKVPTFDTVRLRKDGSPVDVSVSLSAVRDPQGRVVGMAATQRDITERKRAQSEREQLQQELSHVGRVTAMGELTSSLAHELRQPLTAILSNAQAAQRLLAAGEADLNELREILHDIVVDDDRAGAIIARLRALLKKEQTEFLPVDLNGLVREVVGLMHSDFIIRKVLLTLDLAPDLAQVRGDRIQLEQVILNLMLNGMDALLNVEPSARRLLVRTGAGPDGSVLMSVHDSGLGIPPDQIEKIFDHFFTTKTDGMGMGLSIARTIVQAHGGWIRADGGRGTGATFTVAFPSAR